MNIKLFINHWLTAANAFDTTTFLTMWHSEAVLKDTSLGEEFKGRSGIRQYFEDYFIGYKTQTKLISLKSLREDKASITVHFTGEFPGGQIGGTFDFVFLKGKIKTAVAKLI